MDETRVNILHAGVKDFLEYLGYSDTLSAYKDELEINEVKVESEIPPLAGDEEIVNAKECLMQTFLTGNQKQFWLLWEEHIPKTSREGNDTQRLEFKLNLYFAVYPMIGEENRDSPSETSMHEFKIYLETKGAGLSQTTEFVAFYALPFVPNPKNHPTFKLLFEDTWKEDLIENLSIFLQNILHVDTLPFLYKLHHRVDQHVQSDKSGQNDEIETLKEKLKEKESRSSNIFQKFAKLQGDYHNLIGIAAELVDSLERCVRGQMITPEYLQDICGRLFGSTIDRPGSAASMLRASIQNDIVINTNNMDVKYPSLDYGKIKGDLGSKVPSRRKTLLLQALIWRLTKTKAVEQRNKEILSYISNDILGCRNDNLTLNMVTKIFESTDEALKEYLARFINVVASFAAGRQYLSQCEAIIRKLVEVMISQKKHPLLCENILGGLQKLSLRRNVQSILIASSVIEWLLQIIEEPDNLSDYALEYTVALLMNLCLRVAGKKRCSKHPEKMLKLLSDLLGFENQEIRQYINGTLYSILALPSFKTAAAVMGLEEILQCYMQDASQDERQLRFILKQLKSYVDGQTDEDIESDGDDDDDDDEEGDAVETECEKQESVSAMKDEESGEQLLSNRYNEFSLSPKSSVSKIRKLKQNEGPLTRPVTPHREPIKSSSAPSLSNHDPRFSVTSDPRPHTSSSRGLKQTSQQGNSSNGNNPKPKKKVTNFKQAFTSRPKIPRSPDVGNEKTSANPRSPEIPPLTRSLSPPRPGSVKK